MGYKKYSDKEKVAAVIQLEASGYEENQRRALRIVSARNGISKTTLRSWYNATHRPDKKPAHSGVDPEIYTEEKESLRDLFDTELRAVLKDMPERREDADYRTLVTAAGVLADKLLRLEGKPAWKVEIIQLVRDGKTTIDDVRVEFGDDLVNELFNANVSTSS